MTRPVNAKRNVAPALLAVLGVLALLYVVLLPKLRSMQAETERLRKEHEQPVPGDAAPPTSSASAAMPAPASSLTSASALMGAAAQLVQRDKPDLALPYVQRAAELEPRNQQYRLAVADLDERLRKHYQAMTAYREILKQNPDDSNALNRYAWLLISYGWTYDARMVLEPAVKRHPEDPHLAVALALSYLQSHDYQRCEKLLLTIRQLHPTEPQLWGPLADLYMKRALFPKAVAVLRDELKAQPGDPTLTASLADALFEAGDLAGSEQAWKQILATSPDNGAALYGLAEIYRKQHKTQEALHELEELNKIDPNYEPARLMLGQIYLQTGNATEGGKLLRAYQKQHNMTREYARVSLLLSSKPHDPNVHLQMAQVYLSSGAAPRAEVELHRTLEIDPGNAQAKKLLAQLPK